MLCGAQPSWTGTNIGIPAIIEAALAINAGLCNSVLIADAQALGHTDRHNTAPWTRPTNEFVECYGLFTPAEFALIARGHMHLYGTTVEQFAVVAIVELDEGWHMLMNIVGIEFDNLALLIDTDHIGGGDLIPGKLPGIHQIAAVGLTV